MARRNPWGSVEPWFGEPLRREDGTVCLNCGEPADGVSGYRDDRPPRPGDVVVCCYCANTSIVAEDGSQRFPTPEEQRAIRADPDYRIVRSVVSRMAAERDVLEQSKRAERPARGKWRR